eukprot:3380900-Rhodomonas_salina.1
MSTTGMSKCSQIPVPPLEYRYVCLGASSDWTVVCKQCAVRVGLTGDGFHDCSRWILSCLEPASYSLEAATCTQRPNQTNHSQLRLCRRCFSTAKNAARNDTLTPEMKSECAGTSLGTYDGRAGLGVPALELVE